MGTPGATPANRHESMRVLLVEDDPLIGSGLEQGLKQEGFAVDWVKDGDAATLALRSTGYGLLLLDLGLPNRDGLSVLASLRRRDETLPAIIITARDGVPDRIAGLDSGADDYLVKPFALSELVARSRALVRRNQARGGSVLSLGNLRMDLEARRAYIGDQELALAGREWSILQFMLSRTGKIVAKEQIIAAISNWDGTTSDNAIEVHVSRLRSKLEPAGLKIRTIRGFGYLLEEA